MWIIIVEWAGHNPPGRFYRRLHFLLGGVSARGSRKGSSGILVQESVVIVPSRSLAQMVAQEVKTCAAQEGWKDVEVLWGPLDLLREDIPEEISQVWANLEAELSRRGPAPRRKNTWRVTCLECGAPAKVEVRVDRRPRQCPHCGGVRVLARPVFNGSSVPDRVVLPASLDLFSRWVQSRFASGRFLVPLGVVVRENAPPPSFPPIVPEEAAVVETIRRSEGFLGSLAEEARRGTVSFQTALHILDAIFIAHRFWKEEERRAARVRAIMHAYQRDPGIGVLPLVPDEPVDLLDAALVAEGDALEILSILEAEQADCRLSLPQEARR